MRNSGAHYLAIIFLVALGLLIWPGYAFAFTWTYRKIFGVPETSLAKFLSVGFIFFLSFYATYKTFRLIVFPPVKDPGDEAFIKESEKQHRSDERKN